MLHKNAVLLHEALQNATKKNSLSSFEFDEKAEEGPLLISTNICLC